MLYRRCERLDRDISQLGFGAMRLPTTEDRQIDEEKALAVVHRALDLGVNYLDTAWGYHGQKSEVLVGQAIKGRPREDLVISTKIPMHMDGVSVETMRGMIETQLERLDTDYIDVWNLHDLKAKNFDAEVTAPGGLMEIALKAKEDGLVRHICFSCHERPEVMKRLLESDCFDSITLQYNLINTANEEVMALAHSKGIGVVVMGPVGGGQLAQMSKRLEELWPEDVTSLPELAIRFVLSNPHVTCAISGMNTIEMVEENAAAASREEPLSADERGRIVEAIDEMTRLADLYCTGCRYCMPCPHGVEIPMNFAAMNTFRVYGFEEAARKKYARLGVRDDPELSTWQKTRLRASECTACGECVAACPQNIKIPDQLREVAEMLGA